MDKHVQNELIVEISGSHGGEKENGFLLGFCAVSFGRYCQTFVGSFLLHHQGVD
jgi:hypothetical protein